MRFHQLHPDDGMRRGAAAGGDDGVTCAFATAAATSRTP
jgi:hypothetical protein